MNSDTIKVNSDSIEYEGNTPEEKELNKQLLSTILELNSYQDSYDKMKTVGDVKDRIENRKQLIHEEYIPRDELLQYQGEIKALEWVLNGSETRDEKLAKLPKASKEDVRKIISSFNKHYKQLSLEDYGVDFGDSKNS